MSETAAPITTAATSTAATSTATTAKSPKQGFIDHLVSQGKSREEAQRMADLADDAGAFNFGQPAIGPWTRQPRHSW